MAFPVVKTGDQMIFQITPPLVVPLLNMPHTVVGTSGVATINQLAVMIVGDEAKQPSLMAPMPYTFANFTIPGTGMVKITLLPTQKAKMTKAAGTPPVLATGYFKVDFTVSSPALDASSVPDPSPKKPPSTGKFSPMGPIFKST